MKDEEQRSKLLQQAMAKNLSLNEIKAAIKELTPEVEPTPEKVLVERLGEIAKRLGRVKPGIIARNAIVLLNCWMNWIS
ncbi:hypothetical protein [Stenomitos frigidus]|uniref:hypothetical protein n=1 Tax=Stenomitos frigidus TaxID=1886765 RepID=UPI003183FC80